MARENLKIIVTGLAATYPFGGVFWDYLQYALGFHRLGHDVLYLEDTGKWCYSPIQQTFVPSGADNAAYLGREIERLEPGLKDKWSYRDGEGVVFGRDGAFVRQFSRDCDLFLHISASCMMREDYWAARRLAFIDSDPMYTQASVPAFLAGTVDDAGRERIEMIRRHHVHFTFGENFKADDCRIPKGVFDWLPTRQPIVNDCFQLHRRDWRKRRRVLTTVASWEPAESGPIIEGVQYHGKSAEFLRLLDLPHRVTVPLELAMSGRAPREKLLEAGWTLADPTVVSADPSVYREYLADSLGEWSVSKHAYAAARTGWFSCRSACYLALGVPVIVQDTGFASDLPTNEGILTFSDLDSATTAVEQLLTDPERHSQAAAKVARDCFESSKVLNKLLEQAS